MIGTPKYASPDEGFKVAKRYILNNAKRRRQKSLDLSSYNLDQLPVEIGTLEGLERLALVNNNLSELPAELGRLSNLKQLYLGGNAFLNIPKCVYDLANLEVLSFHNNLVTDLDFDLSSLLKLKDLDCSGNALGHLPDCIGNMIWLDRLDISHNQIEELSVSIGELVNLDWLSLSNNMIRQLPSSISNLRNLTGLHLSNNELRALPVDFDELNSLESLSLADNQFREFPLEICALRRLVAFDLSSNQLRSIPSEIGLLRSLHYINLSENQIELIPNELGSLPNLTTLDLSSNKISNVPQSFRNLKYMRDLSIGYNNIGVLPSVVEAMPRLEVLRMAANNIREVPSSIYKLRKLRRLDLTANNIEQLPSEIGNLSGLKTLVLADNNLSDLPDSIGELRELWRLDLRDNNLREINRSLGQVSFDGNESFSEYGIQIEKNPLPDPYPAILEHPQPDKTRMILEYLRTNTASDYRSDLNSDSEIIERFDTYPDVPIQSSGPHFELDDNNVITFAPPGSIDSEGNNVARLRKLHPLLKSMATELIALLSSGNVPQGPLRDRAAAYLNLIDCEIEEIDFDLLYAEGVRLANAERASTLDGELPALPAQARELTDSLLQIHGAFVLSTKAGLDCIALENRYTYSPSEEADFRFKALALADELKSRPDIIHPDAAQFVQEVSSEIGAGRIPERSGVIATGALKNLTITFSAAATMAAIPWFAGSYSPMVGSASAAAGTWITLESLKKTKAYLAATTVIARRVDDVVSPNAANELWESWRRLKPQLDFFQQVEPRLRAIARTREEFRWLGELCDWLRSRK